MSHNRIWFASLTASLLFALAGCGLDNNFRTDQITSNPVKPNPTPTAIPAPCAHPDADRNHPICKEYQGACIFYACLLTDDPHVIKADEFKRYINEQVPAPLRIYSRVFHEPKLCEDKGLKLKQVVFTVEPAPFVDLKDLLARQPQVSVLRANGAVAQDATNDLSLEVYSGAGCSGTAVASALWSMSTSNPSKPVSGILNYTALKFEQLGIYSLKVSTPGLEGDCSESITVGAEQLSFTKQPSAASGLNQVLINQPQVSLKNSLGEIKNKILPITLTLHQSATCADGAVASVLSMTTANPANLTGGTLDYTGLKLSALGTYYLKATSGALSACSQQVVVSSVLAAVKFLPPNVAVAQVLKRIISQAVPAGLIDGQGLSFKEAGKNIELKLFSNDSCTQAAANGITAANLTLPTNSDGEVAYQSLRFEQSGSYYLGVSTAGIGGDCFGPVLVADHLAFRSFPASGQEDANLADIKVDLLNAGQQLVELNSEAVTLGVYQDQQCSIPLTSSDWSVQAPTVNSQSGQVTFKQLQIKKFGTVYIQAKHDLGQLLSTKCELIAIGAVGSSLAFVAPLQPLRTVKGRALNPSPAAEILNNNGVRVPLVLTIGLSSHADSACVSTALNNFTKNATPLESTAGLIQWSAVKYTEGGLFYFKASSGALAAACSVGVEVADQMMFGSLPASLKEDQQISLSVDLKRPGQKVLLNGEAITLGVFSDAQCKQAVSASLWSVQSASVASFEGTSVFEKLNFKQAGNYFIGATHGELGTICSPSSIKVDATARSLAWGIPDASVSGLVNVPLTQQPVVKVLGLNNQPFLGPIPVTLNIFLDAQCSQTANANQYALTSAEVISSQGSSLFAGLSFKQWTKIAATDLGQFYLKGSSPDLVSTTCYGPIKISDALRFAEQPQGGDEKVNVSAGKAGPGLPLSGLELTWTLHQNASCSDAASTKGSFTSNMSNTDAQGLAMNQYQVQVPGTYYVKVVAAGLAPACSQGFTVKQVIFPGCMEALASNYLSSANQENGTCQYTLCNQNKSDSYNLPLNQQRLASFNAYKIKYPTVPVTVRCSPNIEDLVDCFKNVNTSLYEVVTLVDGGKDQFVGPQVPTYGPSSYLKQQVGAKFGVQWGDDYDSATALKDEFLCSEFNLSAYQGRIVCSAVKTRAKLPNTNSDRELMSWTAASYLNAVTSYDSRPKLLREMEVTGKDLASGDWKEEFDQNNSVIEMIQSGQVNGSNNKTMTSNLNSQAATAVCQLNNSTLDYMQLMLLVAKPTPTPPPEPEPPVCAPKGTYYSVSMIGSGGECWSQNKACTCACSYADGNCGSYVGGVVCSPSCDCRQCESGNVSPPPTSPPPSPTSVPNTCDEYSRFRNYVNTSYCGGCPIGKKCAVYDTREYKPNGWTCTCCDNQQYYCQ